MKALIFAAGLGTRLKPLTDTLPKALVPVGGVPLLERLILKMKAAGITDLTVNVHHFAEKIIAFLSERNQFGIRIRISDERAQLLETGGGIRHAIPLLRAETDDKETPILIHNVDILSNLDLAEFATIHPDADATLLVSSRPTDRYLLFNEENRLMGWTHTKTGAIKSPYPDLNVAACRKYAFAGIHLFSPRLFPDMESWKDPFSVIDFYLSLANKRVIKAFPKEDLRLVDVGKLDSLSAAEKFLLEQP